MIILLSGPDSYRIQQKLNKYKQKFLRDVDSTGINIEVLEGKDVTVESFRKAVLSGGLFVKKRLVIIKNLFSNCKDDNIFQEIKNYVSKKEDDTENSLIFIEILSGSKHQISNELFALLQKQKFSERFDILAGAKLTNWVKTEVGSRGGKMSSQALSYLTLHIGSDLWQLSNEIDKLVAYKSKNEIQLEDAKLFVKAKLDENIFNLTDALGRKDKATACKLISDQFQAGSHFQYILTMLSRQIKILLQLKEALDSGVDQRGLARELGLHPFVVQKSVPQAWNFKVEELKKIYESLLDIDIRLKTSNLEPEVLFDLLVARMDTN